MAEQINDREPSFVELNRRFRKLEPKTKAEEAALESYTLRLPWQDSSLSWEDLLKESRVVVLGEAGSGKTWELRERVNLLAGQGVFAFFIRLEQLIKQQLKVALSAAEYRRFTKWKRSNKPAYLFLDSVDEAKFGKVSDFYATLAGLRNEIGTELLGQTKIFLSSRISEWKPLSDAFEFQRLFPLPPTARVSEGGESDSTHNGNSIPLVVHIEPLDQTQVERLARARGVLNVREFIEALDRAFAWEFVRRPLDVSDLIGFWKENGRIGSLKELIEFDVSSKLRPRSSRDEHPLSEAEGQEGAKCLAAASLFCRKFSFVVPDDNTTKADALYPLKCLPSTWSEDRTRALLNRALFDSAVYGRFRFHHRRVGEYLAANWIVDRMKEGCPQYELESILTENVRGRKVLRPALRSVVAWLCCGNERWNQLVRALVIETDPEILLNFGDPAKLPIEYRRQVLAALSRLSRGRRRTWIQSSHECLARFADPFLAPHIKTHILDRTLSVDFRIEMLEIVRYGRLTECLEAAVSIIASPDESDEIKQFATTAIGAVESEAIRAQLFQTISRFQHISNRLCARVIEALYPSNISSAELVSLLAKTKRIREFSVDLPYHLRTHLGSVLTPDEAGDMLKELLILGQKPPHLTHRQKTVHVSDQFYWVGEIIPTVLDILFRKPTLSVQETDVSSEALQFLGCTRELHPSHDRDETNALNEGSCSHLQVRQRYLWLLAAAYRAEHQHDATTAPQLFDYWEVLRLTPKDFSWLAEDIQKREKMDDRILALRLAIEVWDASGRQLRERWRLCRASRWAEELRRIYKASPITGFLFPLKKVWWQKVRYRYSKWWWIKRIDLVRAWWRLRRDNLFLRRKLKLLASGKQIQWLSLLSREANEKNANHWTANSWSDLERKRGRWITRATKRGCMAVWRRHTPQLPHEKPDAHKTSIVLIVGLTGLHVEFDEDPSAISNLSEEEASLAARYAMDELNGFPVWLESLAIAKPEAVRRVLCECIDGEWRFPADRHDANEVFARLAWRGGALVQLIREKVVSLLSAGDPPNYAILRSAVAVLMGQTDPPLASLAQLAAQRASMSAEFRARVLWLSIWLQIDGESAVQYLQSSLDDSANSDNLVVNLCSALSGEEIGRGPFVTNPSYLRPVCLRHLIPLVCTHVRFSDDIDHTSGGVYSPTARDHAQRFRSVLVDHLAKAENAEASDCLRELAGEPVMSQVRDWILNLLEQRLESEADFSPWTPQDLRDFAQQHEVDPKTDAELFTISCKRIRELKFDVEQSDNSLRDELHPDSKEIHFRRWLARKLNERARGRYSVPQEPEIDLQQKPDLRFLRPSIPPTSVEAKLADLGWSLRDLLERLENQLVGQYLRDHQSRYGIYVIGTLGRQQQWKNPQNGKSLTFDEIISVISAQANELVQSNPRIGNLFVVGIDFREPLHS